MAGYPKMSEENVHSVLKQKLKRKTVTTVDPLEQERKTVTTVRPLEQGSKFGNKFSYHIDKVKKIILVTTPINATDLDTLLASLEGKFEHEFVENYQAGQPKPESIKDYHVLTGLIGTGTAEQHIVTAHVPPRGAAVQIFDSKESHVGRFFSVPDEAMKIPFTLQLQGEERALDYQVLGTQSLIDGVSCGYHTTNNLLQSLALLQNGQEITSEALLKSTGNPVAEISQLLEMDKPGSIPTGFTSFLQQAWQDTYMRGKNDDERKHLNFNHYFLGWPDSDGAASKIIYFLTLGFLINPLVSLLKLPTEFLFNALSETANYFRNMLISWGPTSAATQYIRSALMLLAGGTQVLFKGISLLFGLVTSPVASAQAAWRIHPVLGVVSVLSSAALYVALILPAGVMALAVGLFSGAQFVLNTVSNSVSGLFLEKSKVQVGTVVASSSQSKISAYSPKDAFDMMAPAESRRVSSTLSSSADDFEFVEGLPSQRGVPASRNISAADITSVPDDDVGLAVTATAPTDSSMKP